MEVDYSLEKRPAESDACGLVEVPTMGVDFLEESGQVASGTVLIDDYLAIATCDNIIRKGGKARSGYSID